jgi:hypothetical protein
MTIGQENWTEGPGMFGIDRESSKAEDRFIPLRSAVLIPIFIFIFTIRFVVIIDYVVQLLPGEDKHFYIMKRILMVDLHLNED